MIYLFDRLYLELDHYIRNDQKKMTALLGPVADEAKNDPILRQDFGDIQLDSSVSNDDLASYLEGLVTTANGKRVTIFTNNDMFIKILAFVCSSVFKNADKSFIKEMIILDKIWIDQALGTLNHRDTALRHKGTPVLDITNLDSLIDEAISITPKVTNFSLLRIEYLYGAYLNNSLPTDARLSVEETIKTIFYDANWLGPLVKTFSPLMLTVAAKEGIDLNTFTIEDLKAIRPEYYKIYDTGIIGDSTCFDRVNLEDWLAFFASAEADFGWVVDPKIIEFFTLFYENKTEFILDNCLNPDNAFKWHCLFDQSKSIKMNPQLWFYIAGEHTNSEFIEKFVMNYAT